jgi:hypothetical protein
VCGYEFSAGGEAVFFGEVVVDDKACVWLGSQGGCFSTALVEDKDIGGGDGGDGFGGLLIVDVGAFWGEVD